jgi:hypothetical protein
VTLVCDNLNTHGIASLYTAFEAKTAHRLARRLPLELTPRNGSWLPPEKQEPGAEMQLSILTRLCIDRRFESASKMEQSIAARQASRNKTGSGANWQFTTTDARIKLKTLCPTPDT